MQESPHLYNIHRYYKNIFFMLTQQGEILTKKLLREGQGGCTWLRAEKCPSGAVGLLVWRTCVLRRSPGYFPQEDPSLCYNSIIHYHQRILRISFPTPSIQEREGSRSAREGNGRFTLMKWLLSFIIHPGAGAFTASWASQDRWKELKR